MSDPGGRRIAIVRRIGQHPPTCAEADRSAARRAQRGREVAMEIAGKKLRMCAPAPGPPSVAAYNAGVTQAL